MIPRVAIQSSVVVLWVGAVAPPGLRHLRVNFHIGVEDDSQIAVVQILEEFHVVVRKMFPLHRRIPTQYDGNVRIVSRSSPDAVG